MDFNTIEDIIEDIRAGRMVLIMDDEDRENEGDLIMAASLVRPEDINFMARHGRGLICLTLTRERCEQLRLPLMVRETSDAHRTNFTVTIEAARGVTTGISAADRATTVRAAVAPDARPSDLVHPGHVFPIMAQPGGVLTRAGHTEAGCDLTRLAGLEPAAVIVEVMKEDGTMARRADLEEFARVHGIKIGTIADLIRYRMMNEKTVQRVAECDMPTKFGRYRLVAYRETGTGVAHFALAMGQVSPKEPALVRVHIQDSLCDLFDSQREECGWPLSDVMHHISETGSGIVVVLRQHEDSEDLLQRVLHYRDRDHGEEIARREPGENLRTYGVGAQILLDLGVRQMRVLSAPKKMHAISGFGLEVVGYVTGQPE
ncbi:MAG: 3,4-dihydroxy-2-butanone-4-phosphate synthase [Gammaproteobacteria bacterium]|nr:3,4-dihydroxy-2-butanone-4-phosphate synthase [Gammaproteobacteria bacterium]